MTEKEQDIKNIKEVISDPNTPADVKAVMKEVLAKLEAEVGAKPSATTRTPGTRPKPTRTAKPEPESMSFAEWMKSKKIEVKKRTYYWIADDGGADPLVVADTHAMVLKELRDIYDQEKAKDPQMKYANKIKEAIETGKDNARRKPEGKNNVIASLGKESISFQYIKKLEGEQTFEISPSVAKSLILKNVFNDDKWGQMYIAETDDDEDPNWIFIEDTSEEDWDIDFQETKETGEKIFLAVNEDVSLNIVSGDQATKKKAVPLPKDKQDDDEEYDCKELIRKIKERKAKAKERAKLPKKTEATKNKEKIEKVFDNVKERADDKDITRSEIEKLISETEALLKLLKTKLSAIK